ncbi:MAG TPA: hypothetical protein PKM56_19605 [Candidatus Rifleibacterium sp.]|mgnify:CR=1 FL=1|nr:hypothetical protein [Candidatus Rifleibacterium sp.]
MKKLLLPVMLGLLCSPLSAAEPPLHQLVRDLGYSDAFILDNMPKSKPATAVKPRTGAPVYHAEPQRELMQPDDLLHPRVFQKGESAAMIPVLMRYHRANPTSEKITRKLAVTCLKSGQQREALYWYTQTYQRDRSDFESLWNMSALAYALNEKDLTRKYLEEYAKVDPNSAWGRMAREFLAGRFSGSELGSGFTKGMARVGEPAGGLKAGGNDRSAAVSSGKAGNRDTGDGILVVEGKRYNLESFVSLYDEQKEVERPMKLNDALKGKSGTRSSEKKAGSKLSLDKAVIAEKTDATTENAPPRVEAAPLLANPAASREPTVSEPPKVETRPGETPAVASSTQGK